MADAPSGSKRRLLLAYADSSAHLVAPLRSAFEAAGFTTQIAPADPTEAAAAIDAANAVIVCWTPAAVASDIVNLQAARAQKARKLAAILLAPCSPPANLGGRFRLADLSGWRGDPTDKEFITLVHALHGRLSGRLFSGAVWSSPLSWGGAGAVTLGAVALITNFGDMRQTVDGFLNPAASEKALTATDAKVEEVLTLLKQKSPQPLSADAEAAMRESIERLLSAQSGARGQAADKLAAGDIEGALADLNTAALEGEKAAAGLSETWQEIGALAYATRTFDAIDAYERAVQLAPKDYVARSQLGSLYIRAGFLAEATEAFQFIYQNADDTVMYAIASGNLGVIDMTRGDFESAELHFNEALQFNETTGNVQGQASDLGDLGELARIRKQYGVAETRFRKSMALYVQVGDTEGEAVAQARLGAVARDRGKRPDAIAAFKRALDLSTSIDDVIGQSFALSGLGDVEFDSGNLAAARTYYEQSLAAAAKVSASENEAVALEGLGDVAEKQNDKTRAIAHYLDASSIYSNMGIAADVSRLDAKMVRNGAAPSPEGAEH